MNLSALLRIIKGFPWRHWTCKMSLFYFEYWNVKDLGRVWPSSLLLVSEQQKKNDFAGSESDRVLLTAI